MGSSSQIGSANIHTRQPKNKVDAAIAILLSGCGYSVTPQRTSDAFADVTRGNYRSNHAPPGGARVTLWPEPRMPWHLRRCDELRIGEHNEQTECETFGSASTAAR